MRAGTSVDQLAAREFAKHTELGSLEFAKKLMADARVSVSPGIGFGEFGDEYVRFAMIENESRTRQAIRGIREMFRKLAGVQFDGVDG